MKRAILCVLLVLLLVGCSYVKPSDRVVIHDHHLNAQAINAKVQVDEALPDYVKQWWAAEAKTWKALDAWAKGEPFPEDE